MERPIEEAWREIRDRWDAEFARNRKLHGRKIRCRRGCDACCHHPFHVAELEAAEISRAVARMTESVRAVLRSRAKAYLEARAALFAREGYIDARGALPAPEQRLPCPALEAGACLLYEARPLICRRYGAPLYDPGPPARTFACELNFQPGETFTDAALVPIQTLIAADWRALQRRYDRAGGRRYDEPATVAHAILEDFSEFVPDPGGSC